MEITRLTTAIALALLLLAVPAWAQTPKPAVIVRAEPNTINGSGLPVAQSDVELVTLRARVDVLQDALTAAQAQIKILTAQAEATGAIANQRFAETRQRWEPELLKAHGHVGDGWTWDWDAWKPKEPPKVEPKEPEKK